MYNHTALQQYRRMDVENKVAGSDPHGLVAMLLEGILGNLYVAKGAIERKDVARKGDSLGKAIRVIDSLRASLDGEKGGEIAANLEELYSYMERRLLKANMDSDPAIINEVAGLVNQIKSGWDAIPLEYRGD